MVIIEFAIIAVGLALPLFVAKHVSRHTKRKTFVTYSPCARLAQKIRNAQPFGLPAVALYLRDDKDSTSVRTLQEFRTVTIASASEIWYLREIENLDSISTCSQWKISA